MRVNSGFTEENGIIKCIDFEKIPFISHGFTTKEGGVSKGVYFSCNLGLSCDEPFENVLENYNIVARKIGFDAKRLVLTKQVHSDKAVRVTEKDCGNRLFGKGEVVECDALVTNEKNVPIGVFTADCTPILMCDTEQKVVAAVHSGWKGTLSEIGKNTLALMQNEFGTKPEDVKALIGPSIKKCHFEVKNDVYSLFCEKFGKSFIDSVTDIKGESFYIDTDSINVKSLVSAGLKEENISLCPRCTFCENDKFFSHRASGGVAGRQCAFIVIK
ncbi:MAG: peptidoglycan editing factor PgeF [Clostridia bacterium]|nr:peptidoglycan editing factor PgeF [Clostridia bacterium]